MRAFYRDTLSRAELSAQKLPPPERAVTVLVHRNHSFELLAPVVNVFLGIAKIRADFLYSEYDDSLSFFGSFPAKADAHLLWLDMGRYGGGELPAWLVGRIRALKALGAGKILVACLDLRADALPAPPDALFCDVSEVVAFLGDKALDLRLEAYSGTRLSHQACLQVARALGTRYIPALLYPALKAVVLDCDNTLYAGVLGEDGIQALKPHLALQAHLRLLKEQGFMLALASKNEEEDVKRLFMERRDFPLRWEDFAAWGINWNAKADNIRAIAAVLNIGTDAMLFVDDNPGELLRVADELPEVHLLEAASPEDTLAALRHYPRLWKTAVSPEDRVRSDDVRANTERAALQKKLSPQAYLEELQIRLDLAVNPAQLAVRIKELLHKTNQFIFTFLRPTTDDVHSFLDDADKCAVTAAMSDRLSDSGVIAVLLAAKKRNCLHVEELAVSCRALGRGVESGMILKMLQLAGQTLGTTGCELHYVTGPRNKPALMWLQSLHADQLRAGGSVFLPDDAIAPDLVGIDVHIVRDMGSTPGVMSSQ